MGNKSKIFKKSDALFSHMNTSFIWGRLPDLYSITEDQNIVSSACKSVDATDDR